MYGGAAGGGKAQPNYEWGATPSGFVTMGSLKVGDEVCTPDGGAAFVTQLHPQGMQKVYKVSFQDGSYCEVTGDHLWMSKPVRDGKERWKVRTTRDIFESKRDFVVPLGITEFDPVDLPLDPYTLGAILGDGCITTNSIGFTSKDTFIVSQLKAETSVRKGKYQYGILGITGILRGLNLLGKNSHTKFIPYQYMTGSYEQRLSLLQGLMDTDGYISVDGKVNYTSMSQTLLDQVSSLVRSVGGTAKVMKKGHTLYIRHPNSANLFRLPRKKDRAHTKNINNRIVSIEESGFTNCTCISISSKEQLYITRNFIVTHNSYALVADPIRDFGNPHFKGLILRRTTEELRELKTISKSLYPQIIPKAQFTERENTWHFPSGATLWMSYLDRDDDLSRYYGQAYSWIGFDELTHWPTPYAWDGLRSRLRTSKDSGLNLYMRATTNPGSVGHSWVKKMFIDPAPANTPFWATDVDTGQVIRWPPGSEKAGQPLFKRRFIPANLYDNPYLAEDGMYEANLLSLPEQQRKKLLYGDWDVAEGAAFTEWNREIHVVEPFDIPNSWVKFRAADYGYTQDTAVLWFAVAPDGQLIVYREYYCNNVTASDLADIILELESGDRIKYGVLDSSLWHNRGDTGPSLAEQMIRKGCRWRPADRSKGSRVAGKNELHRRLQVDPYTEQPGLVFFNTCTKTIAQIPLIPLDKKNLEDVDTKSEDHGYDALRYGIMSRPKPRVFDFGSVRKFSGFQPVDKVFGY